MFEDIFNIWVMLLAVVPILGLLSEQSVTGGMGVIGKIILAEIALYLLCIQLAGYHSNPNDYFICYQPSVILAVAGYYHFFKKSNNT